MSILRNVGLSIEQVCEEWIWKHYKFYVRDYSYYGHEHRRMLPNLLCKDGNEKHLGTKILNKEDLSQYLSFDYNEETNKVVINTNNLSVVLTNKEEAVVGKDIFHETVALGSTLSSLTNGDFEWGYIDGTFIVKAPWLTSLEGGPKEVGFDYVLGYCRNLQSLEYMAPKVRGYFDVIAYFENQWANIETMRQYCKSSDSAYSLALL